jgi:hypothetical protein
MDDSPPPSQQPPTSSAPQHPTTIIVDEAAAAAFRLSFGLKCVSRARKTRALIFIPPQQKEDPGKAAAVAQTENFACRGKLHVTGYTSCVCGSLLHQVWDDDREDGGFVTGSESEQDMQVLRLLYHKTLWLRYV